MLATDPFPTVRARPRSRPRQKARPLRRRFAGRFESSQFIILRQNAGIEQRMNRLVPRDLGMLVENLRNSLCEILGKCRTLVTSPCADPGTERRIDRTGSLSASAGSRP